MGIEQQTLSNFISDVESQITIENMKKAANNANNKFEITLNFEGSIAKATEGTTRKKGRKGIHTPDKILTKEANTITGLARGCDTRSHSVPTQDSTDNSVEVAYSLGDPYKYPIAVFSSGSAVALLDAVHNFVALLAAKKNWIIGSLFLFAFSGKKYSALLDKINSAQKTAEAEEKEAKEKAATTQTAAAEKAKEAADETMSSVETLAEQIVKEQDNISKLRKDLAALREKLASANGAARLAPSQKNTDNVKLLNEQMSSGQGDLDKATRNLDSLLKKQQEEAEKLKAEKDAIEKAQANLPKDMPDKIDTSVYKEKIVDTKKSIVDIKKGIADIKKELDNLKHKQAIGTEISEILSINNLKNDFTAHINKHAIESLKKTLIEKVENTIKSASNNTKINPARKITTIKLSLTMNNDFKKLIEEHPFDFEKYQP